MAPRFALYTAPPADHPLHRFAAQWLGWDPETGETLPPQPAAGLPAARIAALTADPRQYGFHGTLKPPFYLADGFDEAQLIMALERFAQTRKPLRVPLKMAALGSFLALRPPPPRPPPPPPPPPPRPRAPRRRAAGLSERQEQYLRDWGYPYVLEEFRLHFTLTGRIADEAERAAVLAHLTEQTAAFTRRDVELDDLCLFVQGEPGAPFRIAGRYAFGG